jgi:Ca2+-binding RTX toxin-like protein
MNNKISDRTVLLALVVTLLLIYFPTRTMAADINCQQGVVCVGTDNHDNILGFGCGGCTIEGRGGDDIIFGSWANDRISGGEGNDEISGLSGNDGIWGDNGNDKVDDPEGNERIIGGNGDDDLAGGLGRDHIWGDQGSDKLSGGLDDDRIVGASGGARDYKIDKIDCGSGSDQTWMRSSDGDTASNCEHISDPDG